MLTAIVIIILGTLAFWGLIDAVLGFTDRYFDGE